MGNNFSKSYVTLGNENRNDWILDSQRLWDRWEERHDSEEQARADMKSRMKDTVTRVVAQLVVPRAATEPPITSSRSASKASSTLDSVSESSSTSAYSDQPQTTESQIPDAMFLAQFHAKCPRLHRFHIASITVATECNKCTQLLAVGSAALFCKMCVAYLCVDCVEELSQDSENWKKRLLANRPLMRKWYCKSLNVSLV